MPTDSTPAVVLPRLTVQLVSSRIRALGFTQGKDQTRRTPTIPGLRTVCSRNVHGRGAVAVTVICGNASELAELAAFTVWALTNGWQAWHPLTRERHTLACTASDVSNGFVIFRQGPRG